HCRDAHQHEAPDERALPTNAIAEQTEYHSTDWSRHEAYRVRHQRQEHATARIVRGKEDAIEDKRRGRSEDEEVVPLDERADRARDQQRASASRRFRMLASIPAGCDITTHRATR